MASLRYETDRERSYRTEWTLKHKPIPAMPVGKEVKGKQVNTVYKTDDLSGFRRLACNRRVDPRRVAILKQSISEYGYVGGPIVVNEKNEVIDGQARLAACQELGKPIEYIVCSGIGIEECIALNQNGTVWKLDDYILSYAESGMDDYVRLFDLLPAVGDKRLRATTMVIWICGYCGASNYSGKDVKRGLFKMSEGAAAKTKWIYSFLEEHADDIFIVKGKADMFAKAVAFALGRTNASLQRMGQVLKERSYTVRPIGTMEDAIEAVDKLYNWHMRENAVDILGEWRKQSKKH